MRELVVGQVWIEEYPVRFAAGRLLTRMTLLALADGGLLMHSPVPVDAALRDKIAKLGEVRAIVVPSTFHHLFVADAQRATPACPRTPWRACRRSVRASRSRRCRTRSGPGRSTARSSATA